MRTSTINIQATIFEDPEAKTIGGLGTCVYVRILCLAKAYTGQYRLPAHLWDAAGLTKQAFGVGRESLVPEVERAMRRMLEFEWLQVIPSGDMQILRAFNDAVDAKLLSRAAESGPY